MTYKEKKVWATMFSGVVIFILYIRRAVEVYRINGQEVFSDTVFWAKTMLLYIGIGVVAIIVWMIIFHILLAISEQVLKEVKKAQGQVVEEEEEDFYDVEDEMDRLIGLKAGQIGYVVVGIGFVSGLISLALGMAPGIMLNIVWLSFMLGSLLEGAIKLYFYKRGVSHG